METQIQNVNKKLNILAPAIGRNKQLASYILCFMANNQIHHSAPVTQLCLNVSSALCPAFTLSLVSLCKTGK